MMTKIHFGLFMGILLVGIITSRLSFFTASAHANRIDSETAVSLPQQNVISAKFPASIQRWKTLIEMTAKKYNLDPNLIASLILIESAGDPQAISSSGAVGLIQIMPRDGIAASFLCMNRPCFHNRPTKEELLEPEFNLDYGIELLINLLHQYGDLRDALFHYGPINAGFAYADSVLAVYNQYQ
ncbi:MAG: transglycosylase SLT domain-containing protein [Anaerolineales bacterium]|nr:transglycosylase SLT domain-containing protein [Anaerolineales bacterium]